MTAIDEDVQAEIREDLERKRAELINKSNLAAKEIREADHVQGGRDSLDESTEEQNTSTQLRLADRDRNLFIKINRALERMDDGDYGYCEHCEEPIGQKRLQARPVTTLCIDCKEEQEAEEARHKIKPGLMDEME
jgi:DnaK suppressor protein